MSPDGHLARLQGTSLDYASLQGASLNSASLQGASLDFASLQGASLVKANLQGASLHYALLFQRVLLEYASLQGALLDYASFQGASLDYASLQGASLYGAHLQGASLYGASLQGASLDYASLQGASLDAARLEGASLDHAGLQGASLDAARLQGALLDYVGLQGASLDGANLQGASLNGTSLWRARGVPDTGDPARLQVHEPQLRVLSAKQLAELERQALAGIEAENTKRRIKTALARLSAPDKDVQDSMPLNYWTHLADRLSETDYQEDLAGRLTALACDGENAPYVAQGLIDAPHHALASRIEYIGASRLRGVARTLLDAAEGKTTDCPGVKNLDAVSMAKLRQWAAKTDNGKQGETDNATKAPPK